MYILLIFALSRIHARKCEDGLEPCGLSACCDETQQCISNDSVGEEGRCVAPTPESEREESEKCTDDDGLEHVQGASWFIEGNPCRPCTCFTGAVDCFRITCPAQTACPGRWIKLEGECCQQCLRPDTPVLPSEGVCTKAGIMGCKSCLDEDCEWNPLTLTCSPPGEDEYPVVEKERCIESPEQHGDCDSCIDAGYAWSQMCIRPEDCDETIDCYGSCEQMRSAQEQRIRCKHAQDCGDCTSLQACFWYKGKCRSECAYAEINCYEHKIITPDECENRDHDMCEYPLHLLAQGHRTLSANCLQSYSVPEGDECIVSCEYDQAKHEVWLCKGDQNELGTGFELQGAPITCPLTPPATMTESPTTNTVEPEETLTFHYFGRVQFTGTTILFQTRSVETFAYILNTEINFNTYIYLPMATLEQFQQSFHDFWTAIYSEDNSMYKAGRVPVTNPEYINFVSWRNGILKGHLYDPPHSRPSTTAVKLYFQLSLVPFSPLDDEEKPVPWNPMEQSGYEPPEGGSFAIPPGYTPPWAENGGTPWQSETSPSEIPPGMALPGAYHPGDPYWHEEPLPNGHSQQPQLQASNSPPRVVTEPKKSTSTLLLLYCFVFSLVVTVGCLRHHCRGSPVKNNEVYVDLSPESL